MAFKPVREKEISPTQISLRVAEHEYAKIKAQAKTAGMSMNEFVRQAVQYALDNMED